MDNTWEGSFLGTLDTLRPFYGNPSAPRTSVGISQVDAVLLNGVLFALPSGFTADPNGFLDLAALNQGKIVKVTKDQVRYIVNAPGSEKIFGTPFGNVPRNSETGPLLNNVNLGIYKNFKVRENLTIRISMDAFNAFNHPNPSAGFIAGGSTPDSFIEDAGTTFNNYGEIGYARRAIQLGAKIIF
jgi:hypothetical protein